MGGGGNCLPTMTYCLCIFEIFYCWFVFVGLIGRLFYLVKGRFKVGMIIVFRVEHIQNLVFNEWTSQTCQHLNKPNWEIFFGYSLIQKVMWSIFKQSRSLIFINHRWKNRYFLFLFNLFNNLTQEIIFC